MLIGIMIQNKICGTSFTDEEGSVFICEKNHVFIGEDNPSSKVVTMEEALDDVKLDRIGNLVK